MGFYFNCPPRVQEYPDLGTVIDFGTKKVLANAYDASVHNAMVAIKPTVSFGYNADGSVNIFYADILNSQLWLGGAIQICEAECHTRSDSFRLTKRERGCAIAFKYGTLEHFSEWMFLPIEMSEEDDIKFYGKKVNALLTNQSVVQTNAIRATTDDLDIYRALGIHAWVFELVQAHYLLYRAKKPLYKNFEESLKDIFAFEGKEKTEETIREAMKVASTNFVSVQNVIDDVAETELECYQREGIVDGVDLSEDDYFPTEEELCDSLENRDAI